MSAIPRRVSPRRFTALMTTVLWLFTAALLGACVSKTSSPDDRDRSIMKQVERLEAIQARHEQDILRIPGVLGMGIGRSNGQLNFGIFVDRSKPRPVLPELIEGVPVLVHERNPVQLLNGLPGCGAPNPPCHVQQLALPVEMGNSGGWISQTGAGACSLGFKACDLTTRRLVFVTNAHCNQSATTCAVSPPGSATASWIHPGRMDVTVNPGSCISAGSCESIGAITGHAAPSCNSNNNLTDATKVESTATLTSNAFRDFGFAHAFPGTALMGDTVRKSGRTTGSTSGEVLHINATIAVPAPAPGVNGYCCGALTMHDQIEWDAANGDATQPGDSGSGLLTDGPEFEFRVLGLNWGSDGSVSYANRIDNVLSALNLSLNFVSCVQDCLFTSMARQFQEAREVVALGHRFRERLEMSEQGRIFVSIYYHVAAEALSAVGKNPGLLVRTANLFTRYRPVLERMTRGKRVNVSAGDIDAVDDLLAEYQRDGNADMKRAVAVVREGLRDPGVLAAFEVKVKDSGIHE